MKKNNDETCNNLSGHEGRLQLVNCTYTCELPENFDGFLNPNVSIHKNNPAFERLQEASVEGPSEEEDYDEDKSYNDGNLPQPEALIQGNQIQMRRNIYSLVDFHIFLVKVPTSAPLIPPPHICRNNGSNVNCHVYLNSVIINFNSVRGIESGESDTNIYSENWCKHPLGVFF